MRLEEIHFGHKFITYSDGHIYTRLRPSRENPAPYFSGKNLIYTINENFELVAFPSNTTVVEVVED